MRIAKNTVLLYLRMLITMIISLYTSRIVLSSLGVNDYGIYNVTGGLVSMFTFLNGAMNTSTQRYLSFWISKGDSIQLNRVFNTSLQIHAVLSLIIVILAETIGLWFFYNKMVIPTSRINAAFWVYQLSVATTVISFLSVPYNASIIAREQMAAFAYISVVEVILKLIIAYLIMLSHWDRLILYAFLLFLSTVFIRLLYSHYCKRHFEESKLKLVFEKRLFSEMFSFAGWSFTGSLSGILYTQGLNLLLNMFFGPAVNAARGLAVQIQGTLRQFVSNFQMALNPQMIKYYASGEMDQMHILFYRSAKFSFYILFVLALPIILEADFLLGIWLKEVPANTAIFTKIMIAITLEYTLANPYMVANQATGAVKKYQIIVGGILLLIVPVSYLALKFGAPAYSVFIVHFCIEILAQFSRMLLLKDMIELPLMQQFKKIYSPVLLLTVTSSLIPLYLHTVIVSPILRFITVSAASVICVSGFFFLFGLSKSERFFVTSKIKSFLSKR